jgi:UDP-N-acetylmuramate dehydrogenase
MREAALLSHITAPDGVELAVERDAPLSRSTTWRIGGPVDYLIRAGTTVMLVGAIRWGRSEGLPITCIGGGSNLLIDDAGLPGLVIVSKSPGERSESLLEIEEDPEAVTMTAGAQAPISWVGRYACDRGWTGLDWAVGLPGTVGGATVNNAGAHGTEIKDNLVSLRVLDASGDVVTHDREWLNPTYRNTTVKAESRPRSVVVLATTLRLIRGDPDILRALADEHAAYRKATQPTGACAGSTFANPPGDFAGRLIEAAGLKGFAIGPVSFSSKHSNFIVNSGSGTAVQVLELIDHARQCILDRFGVTLHTEIEFLSRESSAE